MTKGIVLGLIVFVSLGLAISFAPYKVQVSFVTPGGTKEKIVPIDVTITETEVSAFGRSLRRRALRWVRRRWSSFLSAGSSAGSVAGFPNFGGIIVTRLMCDNGVTAFTIAPVAGLWGPYGVREFSTPPLYGYWSVMPGNWALGRAPIMDVCVICRWGFCLSFPVYGVTMPGMGTSR
jgi:hypothetical protein